MIILTQLICNRYKKAELILFEEGYSTYTKPLIQKPAVRILFHLFFGNLEKKIHAIYLFYPELLQINAHCPKIRIPVFDKTDQALRDLINRIFDFDPRCLQIPEKYIFFEESFRLSGTPIDDITLIRELQDKISPQKICIKQHPRSLSNPFKNMDIHVLDSLKHVPWEVVLLNECITEDKVLVTVSSGSVLASALYFKQKHKSIMMYKCVHPTSPAINSAFLNYMNAVQKITSSVYIPNSINEI